MGDLIDLAKRLKKPEFTFMQCGCGTEESVVPLILHDAAGPIIAAVVCPACEETVQVVNGRLQL